MIIITNDIERNKLKYDSPYLASIIISDIVYECLMTANLSTIHTKHVHIYTIGVQMLCNLFRPNTE